jgi:hypothetical protein
MQVLFFKAAQMLLYGVVDPLSETQWLVMRCKFESMAIY